METKKRRYAELEKEFGREITTNLKNHFVVRIINETGNIEVSPLFEFLDERVQKLFLHHVIEMYALNEAQPMNPQNDYEADKKAIDKMISLYPNVEKAFWIRAFSMLVSSRFPQSHRSANRLQRMIYGLYYTEKQLRSMGVLVGMEEGEGDLDEALAEAVAPAVK